MNTVRVCLAILVVLSLQTRLTSASPPTLIIVEDHGGVSAIEYYRALNLQQRVSVESDSQTPARPPPTPPRPYQEHDFLPVRSDRLEPGAVAQRSIDIPGLTPMFLIGDDSKSRAWLRNRLPDLQQLRAIGIVVNVDTEVSMTSLRQLAKGLTLVPSPGEDIAGRLGITHYPVLITATGIEQ